MWRNGKRLLWKFIAQPYLNRAQGFSRHEFLLLFFAQILSTYHKIQHNFILCLILEHQWMDEREIEVRWLRKMWFIFNWKIQSLNIFCNDATASNAALLTEKYRMRRNFLLRVLIIIKNSAEEYWQEFLHGVLSFQHSTWKINTGKMFSLTQVTQNIKTLRTMLRTRKKSERFSTKSEKKFAK